MGYLSFMIFFSHKYFFVFCVFHPVVSMKINILFFLYSYYFHINMTDTNSLASIHILIVYDNRRGQNNNNNNNVLCCDVTVPCSASTKQHSNIKKTFLQDFIIILKRKLQNCYKTFLNQSSRISCYNKRVHNVWTLLL